MFRTVTPIFSIIIAIAVYSFFSQTVWERVESVKAETAEYTDAIEKSERFNQKMEGLIAKKNSFSQRDLQRLYTLVPEEVDEVRLLVDLSELAKKHRLLFGNVTVDGDAVNTDSANKATKEAKEETNQSITIDDLSSTDISFGLIGTYEQFRAFLAELETSLTLIEVVNISFDASDSTLQQFELSVRTYALSGLSK